jgi:membrane protein implicated in regulation of membrane protease activity
MFIFLFAVSVILAFGLAFGASWIFRRMVEKALSKHLAENVSHATAKYLQIAIVVVGVSSGTRIQMLKDYVNTPAYNAEALQAQMTTGLWSLALYNTATDTLLGILWLMIVFAFLAAVAVAFIRRSKIRWLLPERPEIRGSWSK